MYFYDLQTNEEGGEIREVGTDVVYSVRMRKPRDSWLESKVEMKEKDRTV